LAVLEQAAARRLDLMFGNQTRKAIRRMESEYRARSGHARVRILHLAYRAPPHEPGPEKPFDFLRATPRSACAVTLSVFG
jgi:hypothetical protein